jgi:uncharacterized protein
VAHVLYGPRRSGKTTLVQEFIATKPKSLYVIGDDIRIQQILSSRDVKLITSWASGYDIVVIDEAQYVPDIGYGLKILVDMIPDLIIIATGSSSFDLSQKIGEPLTGRKKTYHMFPCSISELQSIYPNQYELDQQIEHYLVYGSYPALSQIITIQDKQEYLYELVNSYLLKDILALENLKSSKILIDLVRLLAFQIGNEVSINELATKLGINF